MELHARDHIIHLGKVLAEEDRRGCDDGAVTGGLAHFIDTWRAAADGALSYPAVQEALALLTDYEIQPLNARREVVARSLVGLRALFKSQTGDRRPETGDSNQSAVGSQQSATGEAPHPASRIPHPTDGRQSAARIDAMLAPAAPKTQNSKLKTQNSPPKPLTLASPIEDVPGVGRANGMAFKRLGLHTVVDLLYHFPHRYDDYSSHKSIADLQIGAEETIVVEVADVRTFSMRSGGGAVEVLVSDDSGTLKVVFFRQPWLVKQFTIGRKIVLSGKVASYQGLRQMTGSTWEPFTYDELVHTGRLVPVHPLTKGLHERNARSIIKLVVDQSVRLVEDYLPAIVRERSNLLPLGEAIAHMHFPASKEILERARHRLGFDEFLFIQLGVMQRKQLWQGERGYAMPFDEAIHEDLLSKLPYEMTRAQVRALEEIFADMRRPVPMARLLQGDVGSGKTIVAASALLQAISNGFQGAIMAPTQILAEQHYNGLKQILSKVRVDRSKSAVISRQSAEDSQSDDIDPASRIPHPASSDPTDWKSEADPEELARIDEIKRMLGMTPEDDLDGQGVRVALLTGNLGARERRRVLEAIANGDIDLVVGTHALITEGVRYAQLGLVCVDEQHRFGVEQRNRLKDKGFNPHLLSMTATPIPRTLTMTIYGDLDGTILDELPPGRQEIRTRWIASAERDKAYRHVRKEISKGRQAFVICPLVEESEKSTLPSAVQMQERLQMEVFPDLRVGLIHGQLMPKEKDEVMLAFRAGEYDILVATAVVEVGIDVPNATTILIEGAERFGLSQLHQFRGRVGRGIHQSYCILVSDQENEVTTQRLQAMEEHTDGFKLAEIDLELRGPGEFLGRRQSGTPDLKVAQFADTRLLHAARIEAQKILNDDAQLARAEHAALRAKVEAFWNTAAGAS